MVGEPDADDPQGGQSPLVAPASGSGPSSGLHLRFPARAGAANAGEESGQTSELAPARLFHDRFELRRRVGSGGNGTVFEAFDHASDGVVALKILQHTGVEGIYAIKDEFRALSHVVSPNLVRLYELFGDGHRWFFTMELVRGVHFLDHVAARAPDGLPFEERALRASLHQLIDAVGTIHAAERLHRDLKPSNVMVDGTGRVVVLDFGLVCRPSQEDLDRIAGTPLYMAPEQLSGLGTQRASDWYSVGVVLFEALTGRLPFDGHGPRSITDKLTRDAPEPRTLVPAVPGDLNAMCSALLARDPEKRPTYDDLLAVLGRPPSSRGSVLPPRTSEGANFVGRKREFAQLVECVELLASGTPVLVLLEGDSGVGKSTLARRFLADCKVTRPKHVLSGRCFEHESVPYKGLDNLIDDFALQLAALEDGEVDPLIESDTTELLRAFPVLRSSRAIARQARDALVPDAQEARHRAFRSLKELIRNFAATRSVLLFIDDLQWADPDSASLLVELFSPPNPPAVFFIGAHRTEPATARSAVKLLRAHAAGARETLTVREISLRPLEAQESLELVASLGGALVSASAAEAIVAESRGNPLFIELLARSGEPVQSATTLSLERIVMRQLEDESPVARKVMALIAAAGEPIPQDAALAFDPSARASLAGLRVRRFVRSFQAGGVQFVEPYHDRIRESVYASLDQETRRSSHRELAESLERAGAAEPDLLARHFHRAGERPRAHAYALRAAEIAASALAFERAAEHYATALETCADAQGRAPLHRKRGDALSWSGRCAAAAAEYLRGARLVEGEAATELHRLAAAQSFTAGHTGEALHALEPLLEETGVAFPARGLAVGAHLAISIARLRLRGTHFEVREAHAVPRRTLRRIDAGRAVSDGLASVDPMRAASMMLRAASLALDAGEPTRVAWALSQYALFLASTGVQSWAREVAELLSRARTLALDSNDKNGDAVVRLSRAKISLSVGNWADALAEADDCAAFARRECVGGWAHVTVAHNIALFALQTTGNVQALSARADDYLKQAIDTGDLYAEVTARIYTGIARTLADDVATARERIARAVLRWERPNEFTLQNWLAVQALVHCDLYDDRPLEAWSRLSAAWPKLEQNRLLNVAVVKPFALRLRANTAIACAAARVGRSDYFREQAERATTKLAGLGRSDAAGAAHAASAGLHLVARRPGDAARALTLAERAFANAAMPLEAASARALKSALLRQAGSETAVATLRTHGVVNPMRWASRIVVPCDVEEEQVQW